MIYTSYFGNIKKIHRENPSMSFFSIAGNTPKWFFENDKCYSYKILAPKYVWWKEWHDKFSENLESEESKKFYIEKYYNTVLRDLNADAVVSEMKRIGHDVCLLCYETPKKFCHRHIVADWLRKNGFDCCEYGLVVLD